MTCFDMTIFETYPNGLPSAHNFACRGAWKAHTVYRELPASTTTSEIAPPLTTVSPDETADFPTASMEVVTALTNAASPTAGPSPLNEESQSKISKAWIAGAVLGPLVGLALVLGGILWWLRRVRQQRAAQELEAQEHWQMGYPAEKYMHVGHVAELPQPRAELAVGKSAITSELSVQGARCELEGEGLGRKELPGQKT